MGEDRRVQAVAEALWRHAGFGNFEGEKVFAERPGWVHRIYCGEAEAALAALDALPSCKGEHRDALVAEARIAIAQAGTVDQAAQHIVDRCLAARSVPEEHGEQGAGDLTMDDYDALRALHLYASQCRVSRSALDPAMRALERLHAVIERSVPIEGEEPDA